MFKFIHKHISANLRNNTAIRLSTSVTRLGDLLDFGQLFNALATIILPKSYWSHCSAHNRELQSQETLTALNSKDAKGGHEGDGDSGDEALHVEGLIDLSTRLN